MPERRICRLLGLMFAAALAGPASAQPPERLDVFIGFERPPGPSEESLVRGFGGSIKYTYRIVSAIAANIPEIAVAGLLRNPRVVTVELDGTVYAIDGELDNAWGVKRIGAGNVHGSNKGAGVRVAVIDTGVDYTHPDLDANYMGGKDFVNGDDDPMDDNHHGTHVSGTVCAEDDGAGVVGVAPECDLYALKVLDQTGSGSWSNVVAAIDWSVSNGIEVTNNSYGSGSDPGTIVKQAFDNSYAAGVLHIAAAGNSGNPKGQGDNVGYPARYESAVAVAATGKSDDRASFSSTGPDVEMAAPGVGVTSTIPGGGYRNLSGTSMASPHVAGTAALVIAAGYATTAADVRRALQETADDLGAVGRDSHYGYGLVDADEAVTWSGGSAPTVFVMDPFDGATVSGTSVTVAADASDSDGSITQVDFLVDGSSVGLDTYGGDGWSVTWDSTTVADGSHTVTARGTDNEGLTGQDSITVATDNGAGSGGSGGGTNIYVWAIDFSHKNFGRGGSFRDLMTTVTIRRDVDDDGPDATDDERVGGATVDMTLSHETAGSWNFEGDTDGAGQVTFTLKHAPNGNYTATVSDVVHGIYVYDSTLDVETSDTYNLQ